MSAWSSLVSVSWRATPTNIDREHRPRTRSYSTGLGGGTNGRGRGQDYPASTRSVLRHYPVSTPAKKCKKDLTSAARGKGIPNRWPVSGWIPETGFRRVAGCRSFGETNTPGKIRLPIERSATAPRWQRGNGQPEHFTNLVADVRRRMDARRSPGGPPPYVARGVRLLTSAATCGWRFRRGVKFPG